jgi:hypothetical protein
MFLNAFVARVMTLFAQLLRDFFEAVKIAGNTLGLF